MKELLEIISSEIEEKHEKDDVLLKFQFLKTDSVNLNNRLYPKRVVERALKELQAKLRAGVSIYGAPAHPRGSLELDEVSHRLLSVEMEGDKAVATAQVLPTARGKNLLVILRHGGSLGVSARGTGSVTRVNKEGKEVEVVADDYALTGIDFVTAPSMELFAGQKNIIESLQEELRQGHRGDVFSSAEILNEQRVLNRKFQLAVSAGYRGTWKEFCLYERNKGLLELFAFAQRCGYRRSFEEFVKSRRT